MLQTVLQLLTDTFAYVLETLVHNLPSLALGVAAAAVITVFVDPEKVKAWLMKRSAVSIPASVAAGAFTPFCACGTMAVVLSMLATALPWGPIMAFLTSSPLMSPDEFVLISGILGLSFAIALTVASILLGLGSGAITHVIEKKTHFLDNQARFNKAQACGCTGEEPETEAASEPGCVEPAGEPVQACLCAQPAPAFAAAACCGPMPAPVCGCGTAAKPVAKRSTPAWIRKLRLSEVGRAAFDVGVKKILVYFTVFAAVGYLINRFIPASVIVGLFGAHNVFAVPLAALVGLPLYVSGSSSIPIIQSLMNSGAGAGAMLAFMITGPGTSAGVIAGISTIMKKNALALYLGYILFGAILMGYAYDVLILLFA